MKNTEVSRFQKKIWNFYKVHKREMPWRGEKDPYKVLVSEIMLQQTQVSRVEEKYHSFLNAFPTLLSLAHAPLSRVVEEWQGLGYNRRAKYLHQFAQEVVKNYKGVIPHNPEILLSLPGIGKGTQGSLLAFAFNIPFPFIETNIRRVYIDEFFHDRSDVKDSEILPLVEQSIAKENPREWFYALMDYGAYLKTRGGNPNTQSAHYRKQALFKGSNREVRGAIVKLLTKEKYLSLEQIRQCGDFSEERITYALETLLNEGIVIKSKQGISLPHHVI